MARAGFSTIATGGLVRYFRRLSPQSGAFSVHRSAASSLSVLPLLALLATVAQAAPGDPFGGDHAGCAALTRNHLSCGTQSSRAVERLRRAVVRCHTKQTESRFAEVSTGVEQFFNEERCEADADWKLSGKLVKLSRTDFCDGSSVLGAAAGYINGLQASGATEGSLDALGGVLWCDATSGVAIDPDGDDTGMVPGTREHLSCGSRVAKAVVKLAGDVFKCHRDLAGQVFESGAGDDTGCKDAALARYLASSASVDGLCPPCLDATAREALAADVLESLDDATGGFYPCPDPVLHAGSPQLDRPTLVALGVRLPVVGDVDRDASVSVRYRRAGELDWRDGMPLLRVRPETVDGRIVAEEFAGSVLDLRPATTYEIELHAVDPDGPVDQTFVLSGTTRAIPGDPAMPNVRNVSNGAELAAALFDAAPGDVVSLADGVYSGAFVSFMSGTPENPIVIRGESTDGTIVDGGACTDCNVLELYGSYVHVERMTLRSAVRGIRFQAAGAQGNVLRRVRIEDVRMGVGTRENQKDTYVCDNRLVGRLVWPQNYFDGSGIDYSNEDGIRLDGDGHVICHNDLYGFGDSIKNEQPGARSFDVYGNEVRSSYDNGIELDFGEGNVRALRNRLTNNFVPLSFQPIHGGPAYAIRNVAVNLVHEQLKFHGVFGNSGPSGVLVYHNTIVSDDVAITLQTPVASHNFVLENNLFVTRGELAGGTIVDWTGPVDGGVFRNDGYYPDGVFRFNLPPAGHVAYSSFADMQAAGLEAGGRVLTQPIFESGLLAPADFTVEIGPEDVTLAAASNAVDAASSLPGVNDGYTGAAADLGALERGCPLPTYGVRPEGVDESNQPFGCEP
jgi:hypothetical protein